MKLIVPNDYLEKTRIDKYVTDNTEISRSQINKMIEEKILFVNNTNTKSSYKVVANDVIEFNESYLDEPAVIKEKMDLDIVYEDDYLLIVNKPSGLVVHPGSGNNEHTLVNGLMYYTNNLSNINGEKRPGIVHRIDKDTSGLLIIAKNNETHELLSAMFSKKEIVREYIALVNGAFPHQTATIDAPIGRSSANRKMMTVTDENSKQAVTHFEVIKQYEDKTLIKLRLETGRTHQIRVHMKYIGFPVFNDPVYNSGKSTDFGQFLHSSMVEFIHPITKEKIHITCDLPTEFKNYLDQ